MRPFPFCSFIAVRTGTRASSLVVTMAFLVILTILAIGINETVRMERNSSSLYAERSTAAILSQNAVEIFVAKLQQTTSDVERHWISQPGQIVVGGEEDDQSGTNGDSRKILTGAKTPEETISRTDPRIVYLHSGKANTLTFPGREYLNPPNLNVSTFQEPSSALITNRADSSGTNAVKMYVRWNYVRKDGSVDTNEEPPLNAANPIVGRYAYWADDESAKINYNLAWKRDYTSSVAGSLPVGHPSRISLMALDVFSENPSLVDDLHGFVTLNNYASVHKHFFNSPADARQVSESVAQALKSNKFEVTHYNHDPDTTFFNEERIVLTTKPSRATGRPYLQILSGDENQADPGIVANIDETKLNNTLFGNGGTASNPVKPGLVYYLSRSDWPMITGNSSFQAKYFKGNRGQLVQFAINIIDYVRSVESSQNVVEPMRGKLVNDVFRGEWKNSNSSIRGYDETYKGLTRAPIITEMGLAVSSTTTSPQAKMFIEVYLPKDYGIQSVNLVTDFMYIFQVNNKGGYVRIAESSPSPMGITAAANIVGGNATLTAGNRAVISVPLDFSSGKSGSYRPAANAAVGLRVAITRATASSDSSVRKYPIIDITPTADPLNATGSTRPDAALYNIGAYQNIDSASVPGTPPATSLQTDDPRVSGIAKDWNGQDTNPIASTWGTRNPQAGPLDDLSIPEQDTDSNGNISEASLYMPPPAPASGAVVGNAGVVSSNAELGYIHTGMQVSSFEHAGIPWRTVRLQPCKQNGSVVPDWAFMDLFTPPITVNSLAKPVFAPHNNCTGGRVNINAWAQPENTSALNGKDKPFGGERMLPLEGILLDARYDATDPNKKLSAAQCETIAENIYKRKTAINGKLYGYTDGYYSQGEVVEIEGVADRGEASEELVRQIANVTTARGNVFSIYTVAQTLKQTAQGKLVVSAENRQQSMIERFYDPDAKAIRFKTIYTRPLTP